MGLLGRINCLLGKHERSGSRAARYVDNTVLSVCRHCGRKMFRHPREGWMIERRSEQRCHERVSERGVVVDRVEDGENGA